MYSVVRGGEAIEHRYYVLLSKNRVTRQEGIENLRISFKSR